MDESTNEASTGSDHPEEESSEAVVQRIDSAHPSSSPNSAPTDLPVMDGPPEGMRRPSASGTELIDAVAGRASLFGFGFQPHIDAVAEAATQYLGDAGSKFQSTAESDDNALLIHLEKYLADAELFDLASVFLCSSSDLAIEKAIELVRTCQPRSRYRTIGLVGSDHGRSGVCRTASGRPELHEGYGPMMSGFAHVAAGDIDALRKCIDDQTVAVLICPVDFNDSARPLASDYLLAVREVCDEHDLLLIIDESQLCLGSAATPFVYSSIADIGADAVVLAGGLFAGLPGALLLTGQRVTETPVIDTDRYPVIFDVAVETFAAINRQGVLKRTDDTMTEFAVQIAECVGKFEFVRDVHATGMTIGVETDIQASELVRAASSHGLRIESAGDTSICIQPPVVIKDSDQGELLRRLAATLETSRREFADLIVS